MAQTRIGFACFEAFVAFGFFLKSETSALHFAHRRPTQLTCHNNNDDDG
jgi:hypothetical protein